MNLNKEDIGKFIGEMKKFISDNEMKIFKSHNEHKLYYLRVFDKIGEKEEYIKISRLRKSPTRYFFEEFLFLFFLWKITPGRSQQTSLLPSTTAENLLTESHTNRI